MGADRPASIQKWPALGRSRVAPAEHRPQGGESATLRAAGREAALEADEVVDVEDRRGRRSVAVGVEVARGEAVLEADEVVDVERWGGGGVVAVGVAAAGHLGEVGSGAPAGDREGAAGPEIARRGGQGEDASAEGAEDRGPTHPVPTVDAAVEDAIAGAIDDNELA